ncbi:MAG: TonB-dependent receptor [Cyclobacteriaceae bacterium]|nr:TonB-dependent receptor [Cyclobacteriaceae bacterium]
MKIFFICLLLILTDQYPLLSQPLQQTIRGKVTDKQSKNPLPGANIVVVGTDPVLGSSTDVDGNFQISAVPVGRAQINISFIGYHSVTIPNLLVSSGKELVINIELEEKIMQAGEIIVRASADKSGTTHDMASVSARTFSVEESQRFAGARNDVSRMATVFAGVQAANDQVNDIVIRGNSPFGLLWRFEGVDIPNPNHFGQLGATGGPVSMLNNNVLTNSDFFTGAFPSDYGNAIAGVFDIRMRNGNDENYEFLGQIGFNGAELGAEGPICRKSKSSFLANYRYSAMGLMNNLGLNPGTGSGIPYYQDLNLKVKLPLGEKHQIDLFALGGLSHINFINSEVKPDDRNEDFYTDGDVDVYYKVRTGVFGISDTWRISSSAYMKTTLALTAMQNTSRVDSITFDRENNYEIQNVFKNYYNNDFVNSRLFASGFYHKKVNARFNFRTGLFFSKMFFQLQDSVFRQYQNGYINVVNDNGNTWLLQPYIQGQYHFSDKWTLNAGLHAMYLGLNGSNSLEPRMGFNYYIDENQKVSLGYGLHGQMLPIQSYFTRSRDASGMEFTPNTGLDLLQSRHVVLAYDRMLAPGFRLKAEAYHQHISDVAIDDKSSAFSVLNLGSFSGGPSDSLVSKGKGENLGIELTLEKFMSKGYYFLITGSLFDSKYLASDGIWRSTAFDGGYVLNGLGGWEKPFKVKAGKDNVRKLLFDIRITTAGGQRYTPLDLEQSIEEGRAVYQRINAFTHQFRNYFRADVRIAYRVDGKKAAQEWAFDVQNLSNRANPFGMQFNRTLGRESIQNQLGIFPMMQYRIEF